VAETRRSDPKARRAALVVAGGGTFVGVVLIAAARRFRPELGAWLMRDPGARIALVVAAVTAVTIGPLVGLAVYLWQLGGRTIRAGQYPPPGLRLLRDAPVLTGAAASRRGRLARRSAMALGVTATLVALAFWRLFLALRVG
jgi:hypothetical protein